MSDNSSIGDQVAIAIAYERERCARLVERMAAESPGPKGPTISVLMDTDRIATAIRRDPAVLASSDDLDRHRQYLREMMVG